MAKRPLLRYCGDCGELLTPDSHFCGNCGSRVDAFPDNSKKVMCPNCGKETIRKYRFCPKCGTQLGHYSYPSHQPYWVNRSYRSHKDLTGAERKHTTLEKFGFGIVALAVGEFFIIVFVNLIALVPLFYLILGRASSLSFDFSLFVPIRVPLFKLEGSLFMTYYVIIIAVILASFILLLRKHGQQGLHILRHPVNNSDFLSSVSENPLIMISQLFFAMLFFNFLYVGILWAVGFDITSPNLEGIPFLELLFLLANAAVYEELIIRVLFIGLPLLIIRGIQQRKIAKSDIKTHLLGGDIEIGKLELLLLFISSAIFGLAHVSSWGWWKFGQATLGGIALGYLFLRVGLHSSIALHFSIDYLPIFLLCIEVFNLFVNISTALLFVLGLLVTVLLWLVAITYNFAIYFRKALLALRTIFLSKDVRVK
ncbi:MAG: zinc-ribbon domain-containing protein [Candidatus Heimdallarchaeota archaeon]